MLCEIVWNAGKATGRDGAELLGNRRAVMVVQCKWAH